MERPILTLDLSGAEGNVFVVIGRARELLTGLMLEHFNTDIGQATLVSVGMTYKDILAIVNRYVRLVDSSGTYSDYAQQIDEQAVMAAVDRLNEQLATLPEGAYCPLDGLYPEFGMPDCGPEAYLVLLNIEIESVQRQIEQSDKKEPLQRLLAMLQDCVSALRRAGV